MTAPEMEKLLQSVSQAGQQINNRVISLTAQSDAVTNQLRQELEKAKQEFGVDSLEALQALKQVQLDKLTEAYAHVASLSLEPATTASPE